MGAVHRIRAVVAGSAFVALGVVLAGCSGGDESVAAPASVRPASASADASAAGESYGGYPSFLPSDTVGGGFGHRVVDASAEKPALATQGDTVRVHIGGMSVLATVTGPDVPVSGLQYEAPTSAATWKVVLADPTATLRLDPATFQVVDEQGQVHDLETRGHLPAVVRPGASVGFRLFTPAIVTGEGRMRWIPVGHLAPVEWDFVVETD